MAAPVPRTYFAAYWRLLDRRRAVGVCVNIILSETDEAEVERWRRRSRGEEPEIAPTKERERELWRVCAEYDNGAYIGILRMLQHFARDPGLGLLMREPRAAHYALLRQVWDPYIEMRDYLRGEHDLPYVYACRIALHETRYRMRPSLLAGMR